MTLDTLASILDANPYPGAVVGRFTNAIRLDFDGLTIFYHADGWHVEALHLESLLNEYSAPEQVTAEIRRILKTVFAIKVGAALSEAEALRSVDPVEYLTDLAAEKMLGILDVAALANARQAEIGRLSADVALLTTTIEATHKVFDGVGVAWSVGDDAGRLPLPKRAEYAVSPGFLADSERKALEARIADLERDLADKDASLKTAHAALNRICEVIGAPVPVCPDDAVEAVRGLIGAADGHYRRADRAEEALAEMVKALDDAGAPAVYTLDDDSQRPIPDPERIRLIGERVRSLRAQLRDASDSPHLSALVEAHEALNALNAPRIAGDTTMSLAARIRAIPR